MALDPAFLDELRARTPITAVIGRRTKLARSGRNWKGCCPFHGEKTPSFYVYDDHFHCFGCGAHGDVISFVMQAEGRSFPEAVEQLAGEAGLDVLRPTEQDRQIQQRNKSLGDVLALVQASWRRRLRQPEGRAGLAYLRGRGLSDATIEDFGLGWSGDGRGGLMEELRGHGVTPDLMAQAGLMRVDEGGYPKGELFFGRVTFPIHDRRGGLVSFGGRILGDGQPKYLNGPETALFSKRRTLFGLDRARNALRAPRDRGVAPPALMVVEGYMDVIALHQAGFTGAVAPLGTALTTEQLETLWRVAPDPILCFDGDAAGQRAASKAAQTGLPMVSGERTLRFCVLPPGEDPDSLIRAHGAGAMREMLDGASPLGQALFDLVREGTTPDAAPEARAAFRQRLIDAAALIEDRQLASEYRSALLDRFFTDFRRGNQRPGKRTPPTHSTLAVPRTNFTGDAVMRERLRILTAILLANPDILPEVEEAWCRLDLPEDLHALRGALLEFAESGQELEPWLADHGLTEAARACRDNSHLPVGARKNADGMMDVEARQRWWHYYGFLNFERFQADVYRDAQAIDALDATAWASLQARLVALEALRRGEIDPDA